MELTPPETEPKVGYNVFYTLPKEVGNKKLAQISNFQGRPYFFDNLK
jgi:hypothetical protein